MEILPDIPPYRAIHANNVRSINVVIVIFALQRYYSDSRIRNYGLNSLAAQLETTF